MKKKNASLKGVIYARYSSDNQREESIEGQIRECKEYAEREGITIMSSYIDRAMSAKTDNRPEFQKMIKDSAKQLFDVVIVWKLDRFARNRYDSAYYKSTLRKNGVKVVSAKEAIADDSTGILLESLLEGYAEFYSAELSEKVIRGMTENALKLKYNGGGVPIGYTIDQDNHFQIDVITAPHILKAFTRYSQGVKIQDITDELNEIGLRTFRGRPLNFNNTANLLKNRKYTGEYKYRDITDPHGIPEIVPHELFERVQKRMDKNKKSPARFKAEEIYLLTAKLRCGKCGSLMIGESGTSKTGKTHHYYKCSSAKRKTGCNKKAVKKDWIENLVIEQIQKLILDDALLDYITDLLMEEQARENISLPLLHKQLAEAEKGIENMLNAIQAGIFTESTKQRLEALEETKRDIEIKIMQEELQKPTLTPKQIKFFLHKFRELDIMKQEHRQRLIDSFVNTIFVFDDRLVLTFNYKDSEKTVSLSDISGSDLESLPAPKFLKQKNLKNAIIKPLHYRKTSPVIKIGDVFLSLYARIFHICTHLGGVTCGVSTTTIKGQNITYHQAVW